nr:T-cell surface glycoprotein CD1a-like [Vicugna pacos]
MLFLQLPLLLALLPGADSEDGFQEPVSFQIIGILSFYNRSWEEILISSWLGELQTHGWDRSSDTVIYLWPWSRGNFSNEKLMELDNIFVHSSVCLFRYFTTASFNDPFDIQVAGRCELHSGETSAGFVQVAYQGSELLSFQKKSWSPKGGGWAKLVSSLFNLDQGTSEILHRLLSDSCPRFLLGLLDAGKAYLQRQVRPEAWLSPGPSPGPGRLVLVCHVSGFYPKPIWVTWMRGEQEQQGTQRSDVVPNADGTWYLRVSLEVEAREASGLSCRVRHSSLGDQDVVLYWGHRSSVGWIFLAVTVPLLLLPGLAFWVRKRRTLCQPASSCLPLE